MRPLAPHLVLGVAPDADARTIKAAYRRLAKARHPDLAGPAAAADFRRIVEAYQALLAGAARRPLPAPGAPPARPARPLRPRRPPETARPSEPPKASLGSTTYGASEDPAEAAWDGAAWYGTSLGEYWQVNPREYADPRKHGPEYLARARRASSARPPASPAPPDAADDEGL